ncbi:unnamed protein product [Didymodactylos carnosus]|uniref:Uncharacterized protein n=1 Tax=Didymodactylos carnosus TaxID=1234261 RepID=A0A814VH25_9BILA|nr:unnamed protein product [Didymodactylos carnosus]CAF1188080.1 unnamed protein product [Didymodactylos carnosus]CAF3752066.1 unnamed protein product [Didymodactylos carnosus]CAF3952335.1 unnamed protein product [Didymodactylos carnosus]
MKKVPCPIAAIISLMQYLLTFACIGLEIWNVLIDIFRGTMYAGIWCGAAFFIISTTVSCLCCCCCKPSCCEIFSVLANVISVLFAAALIIISIIFLNNLTLCVLPANVCNGTAILSDEINQATGTNFASSIFSASIIHQPITSKILPLRLLVAAGACMAATNIIYIGIFIIRNCCCKK